MHRVAFSCFFFFNDTATTEIYTLSLHDALPICQPPAAHHRGALRHRWHAAGDLALHGHRHVPRSEEHTSELQSRLHLVCRLLLEKKKAGTIGYTSVQASVQDAHRTIGACTPTTH